MSRTVLAKKIKSILSSLIHEEISKSGTQFSRRASFKLAGSGMISYLTACKTLNDNQSSLNSAKNAGVEVLPNIAIIGGGASGLSALHYLKKAGVEADLYEASDRFGGRIFTQYNFNEEGMFCERGGELIDTGHKEIQDLMKDFGLELEKLPDENLPSEVHYFGKFKTEQELLDGFKPIAKVIAKDAKEFIVNGEFTMPSYKDPISKRVRKLDSTSLENYLNEIKNQIDNGSLPASISEKANAVWVLELIKVAYTGEYGLDVKEQSAINLVSFIGTEDGEFKMFGESDELFRVKGGNSELIKKLVEATKGNHSLGHKLHAIHKSKSQFQLLFNVKGRVVEKKYDLVVMTLPFTVLKNISGLNEIGLSPRKFKAIQQLGYGTNSKLMLGFKSQYWRIDPSDNSKIATKFPPNDGAVLSDLAFQGGWETSRKQNGKLGIFTNFMGGKYALNADDKYVDKALNDLKVIYPGIDGQYSKKFALQNWTKIETAKGSYICPRPGQYIEFNGCMGETECNGKLFFAGEHTSEAAAGFMSGAVESGLRVATEIINSIGVSKKS